MVDKKMKSKHQVWDEVERARRRFKSSIEEFKQYGGRYHNPAPELPQHCMDNCRIFKNRNEMIKQLPMGAVVCEVGVDRGEFSKVIIETMNPKEFHMIDIDMSRLQEVNIKSEQGLQLATLHEGDSSTILSSFEDEKFDWIYIDADHYYDGVKKDIEAARKKIKKSGYLVFNDYAVWSVQGMTHCGVARAVNELCINGGWDIVLFAFQPMGYYDIALQKKQ